MASDKDVPSFAGAAVFLISVTAAVVCSASGRVLPINPVEALRAE